MSPLTCLIGQPWCVSWAFLVLQLTKTFSVLFLPRVFEISASQTPRLPPVMDPWVFVLNSLKKAKPWIFFLQPPDYKLDKGPWEANILLANLLLSVKLGEVGIIHFSHCPPTTRLTLSPCRPSSSVLLQFLSCVSILRFSYLRTKYSHSFNHVAMCV
jgi:hypothetical protein